MAAAEKINSFYSPAAAISPAVVLSTPSVATSPSAASSLAGRSVVLTSQAPTLQADLQSLLGNSADATLLADASILSQLLGELSAGAPSASLLSQIQSAFTALLKDLPSNTQTAALLPSLQSSLAAVLQLTPSSSASQVEQATSQFFTQLVAYSQAAAPSVSSQDTPQSRFAILISMLTLCLDVQLSFAKLQSEQTNATSTMLTQTAGAAKIANDKAVAAIQKQEAEIQAQEHESFWQRLGSDILGALMTALSFVFLGPVAAAVVLTLFVLQQTGTTDKMFSGIGSSWLKSLAEIGFAVGVALLGGGASALADTTLATSAESGASVGAQAASAATASAASSAASNAAEVELENLAASAARNGIDDAAANAVDNSAESSGITMGSQFTAAAKGIFFQSLFSTTFISDLATAMANGDKEKAQYLTLALTIAAVMASMKMTLSAGSSSATAGTVISENAGKAAANADSALSQGFWKGMESITSLFQSKAMSLISLSAVTMSTYFGVKLSQSEREEADTVALEGQTTSEYNALMSLTKILQSMLTSFTKYDQASMQGISASTQTLFQNVVLPYSAAAQAMA